MSASPDQENLLEFLGEARPLLSECEGALLQWERAPGSREILDQLFRCFHSLKGISCFFDFEQIDNFIHKAETLLDNIRQNKLPINEDTITTFLKVIHALRIIFKNLEQTGEEGEGDYEILVTELKLKTLLKQAEGELDAGSVPQTDEVALVETIASPFIRVQTKQLEKIVALVQQLQTTQESLARRHPSDALTQITPLILQLKQELGLIQKKPISQIWERFPALVRKIALSQGKQIRLEMQGETTPIETVILEAILDPLTHLLRNAIDHGIETPAQREAQGKSPEGRISLQAFLHEGLLTIEMTDDGRGIGAQAVLEAAVKGNYLSLEEASTLNLAQTYELLLLPGFSTAPEVTKISGRGVGLNIVKTNLDKIAGKIKIDSTLGQGTSIRLLLPENPRGQR